MTILRLADRNYNEKKMQGKFGLMAAWGDYPLVVAKALRQQNYEIVGLGIKDHVAAHSRGTVEVKDSLVHAQSRAVCRERRSLANEGSK